MANVWMVILLLTGLLLQVKSVKGDHHAQCGQRHHHSYVIGGQDAKRGDWPWQVIIMRNPGRRGICGGALLYENWVLTAAHCFGSSKDPSNYLVGVGYHNRANPLEQHRQDIKVGRIIIHPGWNTKTLHDDIALIQLQEPVTFNKYVTPVCPPSRQFLLPGTRCFITGWGKMKSTGRMVSVLQQGALPVVPVSECQRKNGYITTVTDKMICAGDNGKSSLSGCHGDSGGPFVCQINGKWELFGVVSWGPWTCSSSQAYSVFTNVFAYSDWIKSSTAIKCSPWQMGQGIVMAELDITGKLTAMECIAHCYELSVESYGYINGVLVPTNGAPKCYCQVLMKGVKYVKDYKVCYIISNTTTVPTNDPGLVTNTTTAPTSTNATTAPTNSSNQIKCGPWQMGEGIAMNVLTIGKLTAMECIDHCYKLSVESYGKVNGVLVSTNGARECYCEVLMTGVTYVHGYKVCYINSNTTTVTNTTTAPTSTNETTAPTSINATTAPTIVNVTTAPTIVNATIRPTLPRRTTRKPTSRPTIRTATGKPTYRPTYQPTIRPATGNATTVPIHHAVIKFVMNIIGKFIIGEEKK